MIPAVEQTLFLLEKFLHTYIPVLMFPVDPMLRSCTQKKEARTVSLNMKCKKKKRIVLRYTGLSK